MAEQELETGVGMPSLHACRGKSGTEKFINGKWQAVDPRDRMRLTQQDGQVVDD